MSNEINTDKKSRGGYHGLEVELRRRITFAQTMKKRAMEKAEAKVAEYDGQISEYLSQLAEIEKD